MKQDKQKILIVLGSGGHTEQMLRLVKQLGSRYSYEYAIASDDILSERMIQIGGRIFRLINPRGMQDRNLLKVFFKYIPSSIQVLLMLLKSRADSIIACGPAIAIHICILGKLLFKKKIIFLESWSRVKSKSFARFVYPFADLFFIQWPEQKKNYPRAIYAGRLG